MPWEAGKLCLRCPRGVDAAPRPAARAWSFWEAMAERGDVRSDGLLKFVEGKIDEQCSKSLSHSIESWLVYRDSPNWILTIPNILGSIIPHNHQPTGVLHTAQMEG